MRNSTPLHTFHTRRIFVNFEMAEKIYTKQGEQMCPVDGYVTFRNSELISGRLGKVSGRLRGRGSGGGKGGGSELISCSLG